MTEGRSVNDKLARILVADDDPQMQLAITTSLQRAGYEVVSVSDGAAALQMVEQELFDLVVSDQRMPELTGQELLRELQGKGITTPVVMITAYGTVNDAVEAMQLGATDFITKPFSFDDLVRVVERVLNPEQQVLRAKAKKAKRGRPIITSDPLMKRVLEVAEAVARSDATVLIQGESGTGKELIARLLHAASPRVQLPFVAVNCAALPEHLLESELFGHEKGAFTGALNRKIGKFEMAHGGTILLDEISEMALPLQAKLLRVLQEREVDRVGGREPIAVDVRVLATTNRNLEEMARKGEFRSDLYYRLNVIPITLPALRDRRGDIKLLVGHFMRQYLGDSAPSLPKEVLESLERYPWPGNVRELQNAVERAAILSRGGTPQESDFLLQMPRSRSQLIPEVTVMESTTHSAAEETQVHEVESLVLRSGMTVEYAERMLILETLKATSHNRTQAAKLLGISIRTLRNKLHEYRLGDDGGDEVVE